MLNLVCQNQTSIIVEPLFTDRMSLCCPTNSDKALKTCCQKYLSSQNLTVALRRRHTASSHQTPSQQADTRSVPRQFSTTSAAWSITCGSTQLIDIHYSSTCTVTVHDVKCASLQKKNRYIQQGSLQGSTLLCGTLIQWGISDTGSVF